LDNGHSRKGCLGSWAGVFLALKGMALETTYKVGEFVPPRVGLSLECFAWIRIIAHVKKRLGITQATVATTVNRCVIRRLPLEAPTGLRRCSPNLRLSNTLAVLYGLEFGRPP
jgi:hypothetical protein